MLGFQENKDAYMLNGEAFVHGLMAGEAFQVQGRGEERDFVVR